MRPSPTLLDFTKVIVRVGLTSFGGGLSGWMLREFVTNRAWLSEEEFLNGLSLAQVFPGVNVVNLSIWIGYRLHGRPWRAGRRAGDVVPPMLVIIAIAAVRRSCPLSCRPHRARRHRRGGDRPRLQMGLRAALRSGRNVGGAIILVASFVSIGIMRWPMLLVVPVLAPISIAHAFWRMNRAK